MTNKQKIAELETKLRRYEKKIEDMQKLNAKLATQMAEIRRADKLRAELIRAIQIRLALTFGKDVLDPDDGVKIAKELTILPINPRELLDKYRIVGRIDNQTNNYVIRVDQIDDPLDSMSDEERAALAKDDGGQYIIGVGLRDDPNDHKSDAQRAKEADNGSDGG